MEEAPGTIASYRQKSLLQRPKRVTITENTFKENSDKTTVKGSCSLRKPRLTAPSSPVRFQSEKPTIPDLKNLENPPRKQTLSPLKTSRRTWGASRPHQMDLLQVPASQPSAVLPGSPGKSWRGVCSSPQRCAKENVLPPDVFLASLKDPGPPLGQDSAKVRLPKIAASATSMSSATAQPSERLRAADAERSSGTQKGSSQPAITRHRSLSHLQLGDRRRGFD
uniref:Uncharacterized protein n=1 Tax=Tetraselmis sp. GSL018 TaxID=582737 RepID=A0A061SI44_9CHLO|mmetsp:Transcript_23559/g.56325  ORF Transcript_23559/g.56325 Transcript_23559/m.56325 type:complete len:223 (-) Transcript_23559:123-791(-)|eukprot:CAMPEP_0177577948 /NCGR_PEP_ID=MMETSP0419_2-20121207/62_1 /TAXON_ID=582737 /ORGANISM="Tetraselmis sp., Strain GSL018" /LENGTH=222 /DNA_ID=CAMNT_0019066309 /DNA_START=335 /DNA_END=1003 /DNA_ORIENTATION=-